jgi:hypothetical protein
VFPVVSRVISADYKGRERKKIIPDSDLIKSFDTNDFELNYSRPHSEERHSSEQTQVTMNPLDSNNLNSVAETEYRRSFTWNRPMVEMTPPPPEKVCFRF